jgi:hypothetical protein
MQGCKVATSVRVTTEYEWEGKDKCCALNESNPEAIAREAAGACKVMYAFERFDHGWPLLEVTSRRPDLCSGGARQ